MRTTFNSTFLQNAADLSRTTAELARRQREVSSGRRLNTVSDDPAAASGSVRQRSEIAALDRYAQTADTANARLAVADSALSDMLDQLTLAKTTILAAQGTPVTDEQRDAYAKQLAAIRDALFSDYTTTFNGTYLFSGQAVTVAPYQKAANGAVSAYAGTAAAISVDIDRHTSVSMSFSADAIARGSDAADIFASLTQAIADVLAGNGAGMAAAGAAVERAFQRTTAAQSQNGAGLRAIEIQKGRLSDQRDASRSRVADLEDANMAESITKMSQADTAYKAALGAIATTGRVTLMDYL
jgi:flagellar hook-associated protein 3 FlgL